MKINTLLIIFSICLFILFICFFLPKTDYNKLINIAYHFINYPYKVNQIECKDPENIYSLSEINNFDCVTFIETVLAQYKSNIELLGGNFKTNLQKMRYKNNINNCQNRNHFFVVDWIKNNPLFNFTNISHNIISADKISNKSIIIDRARWFREKHNLNIKSTLIKTSMKYISFNYFLEIEKCFLTKNLPQISIIGVVGNSQDIDINHVGFLINRNDKITLLHASLFYKKVIEEDLFKYVRKLQKNKKFQGIVIFNIDEKINLQYQYLYGSISAVIGR